MLLNLSQDILFEIVKFIDVKATLRLSEVNVYLFNFCSSNHVWMYFFTKRFPKCDYRIQDERESYKAIHFTTRYCIPGDRYHNDREAYSDDIESTARNIV